MRRMPEKTGEGNGGDAEGEEREGENARARGQEYGGKMNRQEGR